MTSQSKPAPEPPPLPLYAGERVWSGLVPMPGFFGGREILCTVSRREPPHDTRPRLWFMFPNGTDWISPTVERERMAILEAWAIAERARAEDLERQRDTFHCNAAELLGQRDAAIARAERAEAERATAVRELGAALRDIRNERDDEVEARLDGLVRDAVAAEREALASWCKQKAEEAQREADAHEVQMGAMRSGCDVAPLRERRDRCEGQAVAFRAAAIRARGEAAPTFACSECDDTGYTSDGFKSWPCRCAKGQAEERRVAEAAEQRRRNEREEQSDG